MVLQITKWDIHPDKAEAYLKWTQGAIQGTVGAPGVVEFRAYRPVTGSHQFVTTYEFADLAAWAAWRANANVEKVLVGLHADYDG